MADLTEAQQEIVSTFVGITGADRDTAVRILAQTEWNLESSVTAFYEQAEEGTNEELPSEPQPSNPQPIPTTSSVPPPPPAQPPKKPFSTLGDLRGGGSAEGRGHDDDDSDDEDGKQDLYAGGEKSGLAVSNPDDLKRKIIEKAKKNAARPGGDDPVAAPSHFKGPARTLGGDDTPSEVIEDPNANQPPARQNAMRILHFWEDGFSVDDGPLFRHDDPQNTAILSQIKSGRAPLSILNVEAGQQVDVKLEQHMNTKYVKPTPKYKPFSGSGQRLGSPTPGDSSTASAPPASAAASVPVAASTTTSSSDTQTSGPTINEAEPVITLQIRLGDGTRHRARFNTTHTIGDVYEFVNNAPQAPRAGTWVLMTTFPSTELTDRSKQLGELSETKRGGTVIQKWK